MNFFLLVLMLFNPVYILNDTIQIPSSPVASFDTLSQFFGHLGHVGIDFKIPVGSEVYADLDGIVIQEESNMRVYGRALFLQHDDGYVSLYAHLSEFKVKVGERVSSGELLALSGGDPKDNIGGDGWSLAPHLHWEIRIKEHTDNNLYNINPIEYLLSFEGIKYNFKQTLEKWLDLGRN